MSSFAFRSGLPASANWMACFSLRPHPLPSCPTTSPPQPAAISFAALGGLLQRTGCLASPHRPVCQLQFTGCLASPSGAVCQLRLTGCLASSSGAVCQLRLTRCLASASACIPTRFQAAPQQHPLFPPASRHQSSSSPAAPSQPLTPHSTSCRRPAVSLRHPQPPQANPSLHQLPASRRQFSSSPAAPRLTQPPPAASDTGSVVGETSVGAGFG